MVAYNRILASIALSTFKWSQEKSSIADMLKQLHYLLEEIRCWRVSTLAAVKGLVRVGSGLLKNFKEQFLGKYNLVTRFLSIGRQKKKTAARLGEFHKSIMKNFRWKNKENIRHIQVK